MVGTDTGGGLIQFEAVTEPGVTGGSHDLGIIFLTRSQARAEGAIGEGGGPSDQGAGDGADRARVEGGGVNGKADQLQLGAGSHEVRNRFLGLGTEGSAQSQDGDG
jgi:hypothetical protein